MIEGQGMDCIVVGGCADGTLLHDVRMDAQFIELKRPEYIKPLVSAAQDMPDVVNESDQYEIHVLGLTDNDSQSQVVFGIAVVVGKPLTWAFTQLILSHVQHTTTRLKAAGLLRK